MSAYNELLVEDNNSNLFIISFQFQNWKETRYKLKPRLRTVSCETESKKGILLVDFYNSIGFGKHLFCYYNK